MIPLFFFLRFLHSQSSHVLSGSIFLRDRLCALFLYPQAIETTIGVVGIHFKKFKEKDYKGSDPVSRKILVNSVSGMIHVTSLEYKYNYLTFDSFSCLSTHLPSVTGKPFTLKSLA